MNYQAVSHVIIGKERQEGQSKKRCDKEAEVGMMWKGPGAKHAAFRSWKGQGNEYSHGAS